jgi:hypothetical protein
MMDIQTAQRMAQKTKEAEELKARREAVFMYGAPSCAQRQLRTSRNTPQQATNKRPSTHAREPTELSNGERGYSNIYIFW